MEFLKRFWARVRIGDDCWEWNGPPGSHGYGQAMREDKSITTAPRMAFELWWGEPPKGFVCHHCNNKMCVRPSHLYDGSHQENMDDVARGKYHPRRMLTSEQARAIRESEKPTRAVAREYGISQRAAQMIRRRITYRYD
jgi:hypothetical protein